MHEIFRRKYFISLSYMLIVVVGIVAWMNIPLEMAPDLRLPSVTVSYGWGSTSPEVMEKEITRRVESAATRLRNVEQIRSVSQEGRSSVTITFEKETPVEYRILELQEYLYGLREEFPPQVRQPTINRSIPEELQEQETFMAYSISGERSKRELYQLARQQIRLQLLGLEGLAEIEIQGAEDPALTIRFDTQMLELYDFDSSEFMQQIREKLTWRSSGYVEKSSSRISMLVPPQFNSVEDIGGMKITIPNSTRQINLRDIADVQIEDYPVKSLKRLNGKPALTIIFVRESGSDAMGLAETVRTEMERIQSAFPSDITLQLERDSTEDLRAQFGDLQYQSAFSLLFVFIILLIFIRRFRAPFVILGSILFSLLMSLGILFLMDYTLNVLTLAGLTVALGMIIDNAVVVFEQINPKLPKGRSERLDHIKKELPYTFVPVLGSTLTTVGIFIPLFFAMEELQLFLVPLAVALTLTLVSSVLIALSWIPYSLVWLVPASSQQKERHLKKKLSRMVDAAMLKFFYWRHRLRWVFYVGLIAVFGIPLFAIEEPDWEEGTSWPEFTRTYFDNRVDIDPWIGGLTYKFFNDTYFGTPWGGRHQGERIYVNINTPQGTPMEEIDKMARNFEAIAMPYMEAFEYFEADISEYYGARLQFYIKDEYLYEPEPYIYYGEAMYLAARTGNSGISVSGLGDGFSTGFGGGFSGQRISLRGFSYEELLLLAEDIAARLKTNPRVREVDIHTVGWRSNDLFQYVLNLDEDRMAMKGLERREVLDAIQLDVNPTNIRGLVDLDGERMYLVGRNQAQTNYEEDFVNRARKSGEKMFTIDEVADLTREETLSQIIREDQSYQRTVTVDFLGPPRLATNYIESVLETVPVPVGASIQFGNSFFSFGQDEQLTNYLLLLLLTILSVWMIVSALLESWRDPLVVILAIPLSLIGVMAGALYHDINFDQGAIAGTLLAVGVVVNNSILLIHEKQRCRSLGIYGLRSWVQVYRNKMRAVMITSLTTMGGLLPMILFGSNEFWTDLAVVVLWGLGTSLTLILFLMGIWEKERRGDGVSV
ncbi:efflux RND transporter permease subunit [Rhodohalobacter sulfatireducens]|uniref:Efflux RND transporter permease subunit n=1 Tax=Rhodohalobacter sulfatireducens TaxID=2911366 RepID=A0ABS9KBK0_9BACT|nr:efflux RND transporter permease subunit [Rhodohalobacter sulfatireducens]MCG2588223.1 efflux RND transporter permease subunit [Rhodohalobacter sulfatireducens]